METHKKVRSHVKDFLDKMYNMKIEELESRVKQEELGDIGVLLVMFFDLLDQHIEPDNEIDHVIAQNAWDLYES